jgi:hypothetical protein
MKEADTNNWPEIPNGKPVSLNELKHRGTPYISNEHNSKLGKYAERCLYELLTQHLYAISDRIKILNAQGGQDFIILVDGKIVYYIEVKSIWKVSDCIKLTMYQFDKAISHIDNYAICVMDMTSIPRTAADNDNTTIVNDIETHISFYTNLESLVQCSKENGRAIVTIDHLNNPQSFNKFCEYLAKTL